VRLSAQLICIGLAIWPLACREGSAARECEPSSQVGCPEGSRCALDELGSPRCEASNPEGLEAGLSCERSAECADGLACLTLFGVPQCALLCSLDQPQETSDERCASSLESARCLSALPGRSDIGACVQPCEPLGRDLGLMRCERSEGVSCGINPDLPYLTCGPEGAQLSWEPCHAGLRCAAGGLCSAEGGERRCVPPQPFDVDCPPWTLPRSTGGALDPISAEPYMGCWPSIGLPQSLALDRRYRLALEPAQSLAEQRARCAEWGGTPAELMDDPLLESLLPSLLATLAELSEAQREAIFSAVWVAPSSAAPESCQALELLEAEPRLRGALRREPCGPALPTLCQQLEP